MDADDIQFAFEEGKESMDHSIDHLKNELQKISTGKANPSMVSGLLVSAYGSDMPMNQVSNVTVADSRTLLIQPWDKTMIGPIEKAIFEANLGVTPQNDGEFVRLSIPMLTEERRKQLVKNAHKEGEDAKVSIRSARHKLMDTIKKTVKDGYPEDAGKRKEDEAQKLTDEYTSKVDAMIKNKETDIMTI